MNLSKRTKILLKYAIIFSLFFTGLIRYHSNGNGFDTNSFLTGDVSQLSDSNNFEYLLKPESCENLVTPPTVLILIHSAPENFEKRQKIRETWGKNDKKAQIRFVLGTVDSSSLQEKIEFESEVFRDLVQETYRNVMALKWFIFECPMSSYLLMIDDTVDINTHFLLNDINEGKLPLKGLILCASNETPWATSDNLKLAAINKEYVEDLFPLICKGRAILYSNDVIKTLYDETQRLRHLCTEDALIDGVGSKVKHTSSSSKSHRKWDLKLKQKKEKVDDDFSRLIDLKKFEYLIKPESCENLVTSPIVLILVHSAPENFEKRQKIRNTWGKNDTKIQLRFMLGAVDSISLQDKIYNESETYHDIVQGSFLDAFRNMTYKHVMVLKWFVYECPKAQYLLKTDDDVHINITTLVENLSDEEFIRDKFKLIYCALKSEESVLRAGSKWTVTKEEYADDVYPEHCAGYAILYSNDVVKPLYDEAQKLPYFWIDNVHITGTTRVKVGTSITDNKSTDDKKLFWGHA